MAMVHRYPWRDGRTVAEVVHQHRDLLVRIGMIEPGAGYTDGEIKRAERRIGQPLPDELRQFYLAARPRPVGKDHWPPIGLFTLDDNDVRWYRLIEDRPHPLDMVFSSWSPKRWAQVQGFQVGGTPFFDRLFWLRGHPTHPDGCMLLTDHEALGRWATVPLVARCLAEYVGRLCHFNGVELASRMGRYRWNGTNVEPVGDRPSAQVDLVRRELSELNRRPSLRQWVKQFGGQAPLG